ncbi:MAG: hypothetical protein DRJ10_11860 [Bacteroidetes bacterium]|nr:MAG: hypothetical protein DRJ10_11860 [Bacteroidota bacterium]
MENEIIDKIKAQISEMQKLSSDDKHFRLKHYVDSILTKLMDLMNQTDDEKKKEEYLFIRKELDYTNGREVKFAENAFYEARKKRSAKILEYEYHKKLERAIRQVKLELSKFTN